MCQAACREIVQKLMEIQRPIVAVGTARLSALQDVHCNAAVATGNKASRSDVSQIQLKSSSSDFGEEVPLPISQKPLPTPPVFFVILILSKKLIITSGYFDFLLAMTVWCEKHVQRASFLKETQQIARWRKYITTCFMVFMPYAMTMEYNHVTHSDSQCLRSLHWNNCLICPCQNHWSKNLTGT